MSETTVKIKTERPDEAEIREMAAKMVEANKQKALAASVVRTAGPNGTQTAQLANTAGNQLGILNYFTRKTNTSVTPIFEQKKEEEKKSPAPDEASWKGHFGWDMLGKCHIPYIFRSGEKYVAVRMVEVKLLNKYLNYLHQDIYSCTCIRSYYITEIEARLLNEINMRHCDGQFGRESFTQKDLVVRLSDANEFYNFLDVCYNKLLRGTTNSRDKCGFIRINKESVVPYTVRDNMKYVPLFYFEGETDNLKLKADQLKGWDLSYLKFCCKVQGIRNELFASETCSVISLTDIKSYFPPGTEFEEYWPNKVVDSQLLIAAKGSLSSSSGGQWTRAPAAPPPGVVTGVNSVGQNANSSSTNRRARTTTGNAGVAQRAASATAADIAAHARLSAAAVQALANGWSFGAAAGLTQAQTQQVIRLAQAQAQAQAAVRYGSLAAQHRAQQARHMQYPNSAMSLSLTQQQAPPPLVRQSNNPVSMTMPSQNKSGMNGHSGNNNKDKRISQIPDASSVNPGIAPYKIQNVLVESTHVPCINMKAYLFDELLISLPDLSSYFFPRVSTVALRQMLEVFDLKLYKPNALQMQLLHTKNKMYGSSGENSILLVSIRDILKYMTQLKYMMRSPLITPSPSPLDEMSQAAKRSRNS